MEGIFKLWPIHRFIPAPAGNSHLSDVLPWYLASAVHPRACGEQNVYTLDTVTVILRFIPAPAGNRL